MQIFAKTFRIKFRIFNFRMRMPTLPRPLSFTCHFASTSSKKSTLFSVEIRLYHAYEDIWSAVVGEDREMPCQREGGNLSDPQITVAVNIRGRRLVEITAGLTEVDKDPLGPGRLEITVEHHRCRVSKLPVF